MQLAASDDKIDVRVGATGEGLPRFQNHRGIDLVTQVCELHRVNRETAAANVASRRHDQIVEQTRGFCGATVVDLRTKVG